jgi:hypothetical protein
MKNRDGRGRFAARNTDTKDLEDGQTYHLPDAADQKLVRKARRCFKQGESADQDQRTSETEAIKFYNGDQWPSDVKTARNGQDAANGMPATPARPCMTINKTREPVRQVLNQERQSDMAIELVPADDFGGTQGEQITHDEIDAREGLVRRIQRDSEAQDARTWAFARSTIAGRGFYGVNTRYLPGKTADQEIYLQRYFNQASVMLDPAHEQPDGSDATWGLVGHDYPMDAYAAEFPHVGDKKNRVCDAEGDDWRALGDEAPSWFNGTSDNDDDTRAVRVVLYYYTVYETRALAMFEDGTAEWVDELPADTDPKSYQPRTVSIKRVKWAKIDGCQVLDKGEWAGKYIPIIKVLGEELQPVDGQRLVEGMVQSMIDPCRGNNYMISKWVEMVGLAPIPPWMMAAGQDEGFEDEYQVANTRALPVLHYNQKDLNGDPAPPPTRTNVTTDISAVAASVQMFNEAIVSTSGVPETALGTVDPSVKSGKLADALIEQAKRGTSNYLDNLKRSIRHEARVINDLLYPIYGRAGRMVRMMDPKGEVTPALLHTPFKMQGAGKQARPQQVPQGTEGAKYYTLTKDADWNVAVKVSKDYDTRREQEAATLGEIISADPSQMAVIGDLFFKYSDGPGHEEFSERYKVMLAPPVQALIAGSSPLPPEVQQKMAAAQEQMGKMSDELAKAQETIKGRMIETQGKIELAKADHEAEIQRLQLELASKEKIAYLNATVQTTNAQAKIDAEDARTFIDALENRVGKQLDLHMAQLGHIKDTILQARDHQHDHAMADQAHAHALEAGAEGHLNTLEQGAQAAALAPAPASGADA